MKRSRAIVHLLGAFALVACSGNANLNGFGNSPSSAGGSDGGSGLLPDGGTPPQGFGPGMADAAPKSSCAYQDSSDHDADGWSFAAGDCNDCDPTINPGAYDVPKDGIDEDCDGIVDDEPTNCDTNVQLESTDPKDGAKSMGLCRTTTTNATGKQRTWGVIDAKYVGPDGTDNCADENSGNPESCAATTNFNFGYGNVSAFGVNKVQEGARMLAISSGAARQPTDPNYQSVSGFDKGYTVTSPPPYPKDTPACPGVITGQPHDGMALELTIRVPTNAKSFTFEENFFTYEFPDYICSTYNDSYVVMMQPQVMGLMDGNIAFDQMSNPISVNNSLLQVCQTQMAGGKNFPCPLGGATLSGTGFESHAATGWLQTTAPVDTLKGKEIILTFAVWDSGDGVLDSTALIDNFQWSLVPTMGATTVPQPPK